MESNPESVVAFFYDRAGNIHPYPRSIAERELDPERSRGDGLHFSVADVEDVVQEACVATLQAAERGGIHGEVPKFAAQVLRFKIIDLLRRAHRTTSLDALVGEDDGATLLELLGTDRESADERDWMVLLDLVMRTLSHKPREAAMTWIAYEGDATSALDEIVARDDCKRGAAKERLSAAYRALRRELSG